MANSREWLLSNEFLEYRHAEIKAGAMFFKDILTNPHNTDYLRGVADMLRKIVRLPMEMAGTDEEKEKARLLTAVAFKEIEANILRSVVMEEG